jgi:hypothetical protein
MWGGKGYMTWEMKQDLCHERPCVSGWTFPRGTWIKCLLWKDTLMAIWRANHWGLDDTGGAGWYLSSIICIESEGASVQ